MQRNIEHHHQYINAHNKQPQTETDYDSINSTEPLTIIQTENVVAGAP